VAAPEFPELPWHTVKESNPARPGLESCLRPAPGVKHPGTGWPPAQPPTGVEPAGSSPSLLQWCRRGAYHKKRGPPRAFSGGLSTFLEGGGGVFSGSNRQTPEVGGGVEARAAQAEREAPGWAFPGNEYQAPGRGGGVHASMTGGGSGARGSSRGGSRSGMTPVASEVDPPSHFTWRSLPHQMTAATRCPQDKMSARSRMSGPHATGIPYVVYGHN